MPASSACGGAGRRQVPQCPSGKPITISASTAPSTKRQYSRQRLQLVLQQRVGERADDGPEEIGKAAEHGHEHELAGMRPVHQLGIGETDAEAEDRAADRAEDRRDDEGREPEAVARARRDIRPCAGCRGWSCRCSPNGECTMRHMTKPAITSSARQ